MRSLPARRRQPAVQDVPVIQYDSLAAASAYQAYIGLLAHEQADPQLIRNRDWQWLKRMAFDRFNTAFIAP